MQLLNIGILERFTKKHADARGWIENWIDDVKGSAWKTSQDVKAKYPKASIVGKGLVIFDVKGNNYRLETKIAYLAETVFVSWAGTHSEYDKRNKDRQGG